MKIVDHEWSVALIEQGHTPILEPNGDLDTCAFAQLHNGPGCSTCGWSACMHCDDIGRIPLCGAGDR